MKRFISIILALITAAVYSCGGGGGDDTSSSVVPVVPDAPATVSAAAGNGVITLSWDSVSEATSYNIYWSETVGVTKETGDKIAGVASPYDHTELQNNMTYYYAVTAENSEGESALSDEVSAMPSLNPPPPPGTPDLY